MTRLRYATAINCIDGRAQVPVLDWMRFYLNVDYVNLVTEPGPDKAIVYGPESKIASIYEKVALSVRVNSPKTIALVAHHDCRANPVNQEEHFEMVKNGVDVILGWRFGLRTIGLWVSEWGYVDLVCDSDNRR